jgi:hypothetical protein
LNPNLKTNLEKNGEEERKVQKTYTK